MIRLRSFALPLILMFLLTACGTTAPAQELTQNPPQDSAQEPTQDPQDWYPTQKGPWDGHLALARSSDGLAFDGAETLFEQSGVPNLLKLDDGSLVLTYQYFSKESQDAFDVIAYSLSNDEGDTWSETAIVEFEGLPEPLDAAKKPMDPTLVQLEDGRLRLYFTYHAAGEKTAALYVATAKNDDMTSTFEVKESPALQVDQNLLDPAVVFFDGTWHHYSWRMDSEANYHSTSEDGLTFTLQEDVTLPMDFLGQVIPYEEGLRFYGTGPQGVTSAFSEDGFTWEIDQQGIVQGADPGVQKIEEGAYVMVYTSMNFNK